jgi:hypothetical protein
VNKKRSKKEGIPKVISKWNYYQKSDTLLPPGLLGPVQVKFGKEVKL